MKGFIVCIYRAICINVPNVGEYLFQEIILRARIRNSTV